MENYEENILTAIEEDVKSNASLVRKTVEEETDHLRSDQLTFFKEGLKKETETYLEKELAELRLYAATKSSKDKMDTKKKLLALRTSYTDELFSEVRNDLKEFVKSDDYAEYLRRSLSEVEVNPSGIFLCREEDIDLLRKILGEKGYTNTVKAEPMEIGGFVYRDEEAGIECSCRLGDRLADQREWFRNHSGFKVKESGENE